MNRTNEKKSSLTSLRVFMKVAIFTSLAFFKTRIYELRTLTNDERKFVCICVRGCVCVCVRKKKMFVSVFESMRLRFFFSLAGIPLLWYVLHKFQLLERIIHTRVHQSYRIHRSLFYKRITCVLENYINK